MCLSFFVLWIVCGTIAYFFFDRPNSAAALGGIAIGFAAAVLLIIAAYHVNRAYHLVTSGRPLQWLRAKLGGGLNVNELARRIGMRPERLRMFKPAYREMLIPKKNGAKRKLLVPDKETKGMQRLLLWRLLKKLRVHPAAQGFVKGRSAIGNAAQHVGQAVVISMDVIDFFPTTTAARIEQYFRRIGWNAEAAALLTRLTTHQGALPQGAPTSPALSNLVNFYMDTQIAKAVARNKGTYTRYADDIAISYPLDYPRNIQKIMERVRRIAKSKGYRLHSLRKRRVRRQHQRQQVTGLVVNVKPQLSREQRRWLRAVRHHLKHGKPATLTPEQLQGWQSYENAIKQQPAAPPKYRLEENRKVIRKRKRTHERLKARNPAR